MLILGFVGIDVLDLLGALRLDLAERADINARDLEMQRVWRGCENGRPVQHGGHGPLGMLGAKRPQA